MTYALLALWMAFIGAERLDLAGGVLPVTLTPFLALTPLLLVALLTHRAHLVALDLAGDEKNYPAELFTEHFKRGRDAGWAITVHAGEAGGAASVWAAL
ncbi:MAG: hypothetical protein Q8K82_09350, partial [Gemmatimonadaceae bacterium]|nr:hypothetical protein [Gemmatimonadaceae bacterium]